MEREDQHAAAVPLAEVAGDDTASPDPLLELRTALDDIDELPLHERAAVFDRTHAVVVEELRALELG